MSHRVRKYGRRFGGKRPLRGAADINPREFKLEVFLESSDRPYQYSIELSIIMTDQGVVIGLGISEGLYRRDAQQAAG